MASSTPFSALILVLPFPSDLTDDRSTFHEINDPFLVYEGSGFDIDVGNSSTTHMILVDNVRMRTVPSIIKTVTWDCSDALVLARFWAAALGSDVDEDSTRDKAYVEAAGWGAPNMWFNRVPEPKTAKNRLHFDLRAPADMDAEVKRLQELGAVVIRRELAITVMQDPEGNEFCVEPGPEPVAGQSRSS